VGGNSIEICRLIAKYQKVVLSKVHLSLNGVGRVGGTKSHNFEGNGCRIVGMFRNIIFRRASFLLSTSPWGGRGVGGETGALERLRL